MKKLKINVTVYMVFCRDTEGHLYSIHGNRTVGLHALPKRDFDFKGREPLLHMYEAGQTKREFKAVHQALTSADAWQGLQDSMLGVVLDRGSVFYREFVLQMQPIANVPEPFPAAKELRREVGSGILTNKIKVIGARCHYGSHTLSLEGATADAKKFALQVCEFAEGRGAPVVHHSLCSLLRAGAYSRVVMQFQFAPGTKIGAVRQFLLENFK